jgi:hypothetical protein
VRKCLLNREPNGFNFPLCICVTVCPTFLQFNGGKGFFLSLTLSSTRSSFCQLKCNSYRALHDAALVRVVATARLWSGGVLGEVSWWHDAGSMATVDEQRFRAEASIVGVLDGVHSKPTAACWPLHGRFREAVRVPRAASCHTHGRQKWRPSTPSEGRKEGVHEAVKEGRESSFFNTPLSHLPSLLSATPSNLCFFSSMHLPSDDPKRRWHGYQGSELRIARQTRAMAPRMASALCVADGSEPPIYPPADAESKIEASSSGGPKMSN